MISGTTAKQAADSAAKKALESLTPGQNYAIAIAGKNLRNGAFWGYTDVDDVKQFASSIVENEHMTVYKLNNACLIEVDPNYVLDSILSIDPELFTDEDKEYVRQSMAEAQVEFEKFLINKGRTEEYYTGVIAFYCTNKVPSIAHKGIHYPAFRLPLMEILRIMAQLGYVLRRGDKWITPKELTDNFDNFWSELQVAPTRSGVFLTIRATLSSEQYAEIKKQYYAKYKLD